MSFAPATVRLATFPVALQAVLPELPPTLESRIVGRDLILVDTEAQIVVDLLRDVLPG